MVQKVAPSYSYIYDVLSGCAWPTTIRAKIVEGRVNKLMAQKCLLEQPFVKNPDMTIEQLISGKMDIVKFERFVLGEGLEKRNENFADEVMSQISK